MRFEVFDGGNSIVPSEDVTLCIMFTTLLLFRRKILPPCSGLKAPFSSETLVII